jgi:uncharacterized protein with FMN-binding domain
MRRLAAAGLSTLALAMPVADAATAVVKKTVAKPKKKVVTVTKTISGSEGFAGRWGYVKVVLVIRKTTTTIGTKKTVARKVTKVAVPEYPNHTDRSIFINQQALPVLQQEVMQKQLNPNIDFVSGATDTSQGFEDSLQAAIIAAKKA